MFYPDYLIHFNKNHSSSTGQFISGDGDGDGVVNDHKNQKKDGGYSNTAGYKSGAKTLKSGFAKAAAAHALRFAGAISSKAVADSGAENIAKGLRFATALSTASLEIAGITEIAKGGKQMSIAARKYNSANNN